MIKRVGEIKKGLAHSSEEAVSRRIASVYAAVQLARSRSFRVRLWYGNGLANDVCGHEPGDPGAPPRTGERVLVGTTMRPTARLPTGTTTVLITGTIILGSGWPAPESRESVSLCVTKRRCGTKPFPAVCARGREKRVMPLCWYRGRGPAGKV
jgi:hypothetical protein